MLMEIVEMFRNVTQNRTPPTQRSICLNVVYKLVRLFLPLSVRLSLCLTVWSSLLGNKFPVTEFCLSNLIRLLSLPIFVIFHSLSPPFFLSLCTYICVPMPADSRYHRKISRLLASFAICLSTQLTDDYGFSGFLILL